MNRKILEILQEILKGFDRDFAMSVKLAETDDDINEIISILAECRNRLLDHNTKMLNEKKEKVK